MSPLFFIILSTQAAKMDRELPVAEVVPAHGNLPAVAPRAPFTNASAWAGLRYLKLEDYDVDGRPQKYRAVQDDPEYTMFVNKQLDMFESFLTAETLEERMSIILQLNADLSELLQSFKGRLGAEERMVIVMFLMGQAVSRHPGLLQAFTDFDNKFEEIYDAAKRKEAGVIDYAAVQMPESFDEIGQRGPEVYIDMIAIVCQQFSGMHRVMDRSHVQVLTTYRNRIVAEATRLEVPRELIVHACKQSTWERDLMDLTSFEVAHVVVPVWSYTAWRARGIEDALPALKAFVFFLLKGKYEDRVQRFLDAETFAELQYRGPAFRRTVMAAFIDQALRIASMDQGHFLAGLIYEMWMTRGDDLRRMWNRNLYHRSFKRFAIWGWRKWLQETVLGVTEDEETKEIVKSLLEEVTKMDRTDPKKTVPALTVANGLRRYANQPNQA